MDIAQNYLQWALVRLMSISSDFMLHFAIFFEIRVIWLIPVLTLFNQYFYESL